MEIFMETPEKPAVIQLSEAEKAVLARAQAISALNQAEGFKHNISVLKTRLLSITTSPDATTVFGEGSSLSLKDFTDRIKAL